MALKKCTTELPLFAFISFSSNCSSAKIDPLLDSIPTKVQVAVWKNK